MLLDGADPSVLPSLLSLFQAMRWSPPSAVPGSLISGIRERAIALAPVARVEGNPFRGLNAFAKGDAKLFSGGARRPSKRSRVWATSSVESGTSEGKRRRGSYRRWLQIEGNSGAGKSSLVNAGMLPMIEQGALWARTGFERWRSSAR